MTLNRLSVVLLACLTLSACGGVDPNSPLGQRKAIFKQMLKTGEDLGGMLRGRIPFDGPKFAEGAVKLVRASTEDAATLRARVTSKGGTTERAIEVMEAEGVRRAILHAVRSAAQRSRELGEELGCD